MYGLFVPCGYNVNPCFSGMQTAQPTPSITLRLPLTHALHIPLNTPRASREVVNCMLRCSPRSRTCRNSIRRGSTGLEFNYELGVWVPLSQEVTIGEKSKQVIFEIWLDSGF